MLTSLPSKAVPFVNIQDGLTLGQAVVDTVRDPLVVLDPNLRVIAASRSFFQTFRLVTDDVIGRLLYEIDGGQWNIPELRHLLETITTSGSPIEGYEVDREFPAIGRRIMLLNARRSSMRASPTPPCFWHSRTLPAGVPLSSRCRNSCGKRTCCSRKCSTVSPIVCKS